MRLRRSARSPAPVQHDGDGEGDGEGDGDGGGGGDDETAAFSAVLRVATTAVAQLRSLWTCPRRVATSAADLARRAMATPATMSPTALAAGDLDGLIPVATRPSGNSNNDRDAAAANRVGGRGGKGDAGTTVRSTYLLS